ncbi:GFA family protein [Marinomonas sp. 2405UD68-3]|uniref:GFA family protein n=1 Tax=Marinomonas sp. 2405UD68-3 TaxID=3391835 RepID=UPI0039C9840C
MKASCLCGLVQMEIKSPFISSSYCHCGQCRKSHGAGSVAYGVCLKNDIEWISGKKKVRCFESSEKVKRGFCKECGSNLYYYNKDYPSHLDIPLAILDDKSTIQPECHIYVSSKADWYSINDELPQYSKER